MSTKNKVLIGIGVVLLLAVLTNPGKEKHKEALQKEMQSQFQVPELPDESAGEWEQAGQALGQVLGQAMANQVLDQALSVNNYLLFSTSRTSWNGKESPVLTIGAFGMVHFLGEGDDEEEEVVSEDSEEENEPSISDEAMEVRSDQSPSAGAESTSGFDGAASDLPEEFIGHWVESASDCEYDGGLYVEMVNGKLTLGCHEWSPEIVEVSRVGDTYSIRLNDGVRGSISVTMKMVDGGIELSEPLHQMCYGESASRLVKCH